MWRGVENFDFVSNKTQPIMSKMVYGKVRLSQSFKHSKRPPIHTTLSRPIYTIKRLDRDHSSQYQKNSQRTKYQRPLRRWGWCTCSSRNAVEEAVKASKGKISVSVTVSKMEPKKRIGGLTTMLHVGRLLNKTT